MQPSSSLPESLSLQIMDRCRLVCEAEAVAWGFSPEAGADLHDGIVAEASEHWTIEQYLAWTEAIEHQYNPDDNPQVTEQIALLYAEINRIMGRFGNLILQLKRSL